MEVQTLVAINKVALTDYKFYCFNGEPKILYVSRGFENHATTEIRFLNLDWSFAPFGRNDYKQYNELPAKPHNFEHMLEICAKLSMDIPFVRVDLYEINDKIYFSELTFTPTAGYMQFEPSEWDYILGSWLTLPEIKAE